MYFNTTIVILTQANIKPLLGNWIFYSSMSQQCFNYPNNYSNITYV